MMGPKCDHACVLMVFFMRALIKKLIPRSLFQTIEPYGHLIEAIFANVRYGFPSRNLKIIGVTGTDGKTTTSTLIHAMMAESGYKVGLMTTVSYGTRENMRQNMVHMTTVSAFALQKRIAELKKEGIEWLVLETTSHALAQFRIWGVPYSVAAMTNVTHEHLDYHKTFERYRTAKVKLFKLVGANLRGMRTGVANADDASMPYFCAAVPNCIRYGINNGELKATSIKATPDGSSYTAALGERKLKIKTSLPGRFNVYNSLAAVGIGIALGLGDEQIEAGIASLASVEGRMNRIDEGQDFSVIVDFAHTPDSFEKILAELKELTKKRLIVVFGSAGRRDEVKRGIMGASAGKMADIVIATEEDDRDIDGNGILNQIAKGAESNGKVRDKDLFLILDRTKAINFAIEQAKTGDTVVFLGKGHEKTIERADGEHAWDESATVRAALRSK
jgi:UDP-N-acetylmuramoyl-L-alanyl-D-glutamate--2,6-diaminopimelate ligase